MMREKVIPYSKQELARLLAGRFADNAQQKSFIRFCDLIGEVYHHRFYRILEDFKSSYLAVDPDLNVKMLAEYPAEPAITNVSRPKPSLPRSARVRPGASTSRSIRRITNSCRSFTGASIRTISKRKFSFSKGNMNFRTDNKAIGFRKGKLYLKLFKNVPTVDIEMLFPDTEVVIRPVDKAKVIVPLAAGAATTVYKIASYALSEGNPVHLWSQIGFWVLVGSLFGVALKGFMKYKTTIEQYLKTLTQCRRLQIPSGRCGRGRVQGTDPRLLFSARFRRKRRDPCRA